MTETERKCVCGEPLRAEACYCTACGREVRQSCPACSEEKRFLATLEAGLSPWCERSGAALYTCENCGRWLLPDTQRCPDPDCGERVLPSWPQHTGRRWDGRGSAVGWHWPVAWESQKPNPQIDIWQTTDTLSASVVAHNRLYLWAGTSLIVPEIQSGNEVSEGKASWRCPLGAASRPAMHLPWENRIAIAGGGAVLASEKSFYLVDLSQRNSPERLEIGIPVTQVGGPHHWVAWSRTSENQLQLHTAPVGQTWEVLIPNPVDTPQEASLHKDSPLVIREDQAYWIGQGGGVWNLDCATNAVKQVVAPQEGLLDLWAEADGPRTIREQQGQLLVGLSAPNGEGRVLQEVPMGNGPFRAVCVAKSQIVAIGESVVPYRIRFGERLASARLSGRWIMGAITEGRQAQDERAESELHLLVLTQDGNFGRLSVLHLSSGKEELLWNQAGMVPLSLLAVGNTLFIAHNQGIIRLTEAVV